MAETPIINEAREKREKLSSMLEAQKIRRVWK